MNTDSNNAKLEQLTAYLDGELGADERAQFESELNRDSELQTLLEQWQSYGNSIRKLPKHKLPASFSDRVMAQIESHNRDSLVNSESPTATIVDSRKSSNPFESTDANKGRSVALALIGSLAAMLLLTLCLTPLMTGDSNPVASSDLSVDFNSTDGGQPETIEKNEDQTNNVERKNNTDVSPEQTNAQPKQFIRNPMAIRIDHRDSQSGLVESLVPVIEQVIVLEFADNSDRHFEDLKTSFKSEGENAIRVMDNLADPAIDSLSSKGSGLGSASQAMIVVATNGQMKAAIERLKLSKKVSVEAISLMTQQSTAKTPQSPSSAQVVPVVGLTTPENLDEPGKASIDPEEAKMLDQWFGLSDDANSAQDVKRHFLIMVK